MNFPRQILDCAWAKPVAFKAKLRSVLPRAGPQRTDGRRIIQLDRISGSITLRNFRQGQVFSVKGNLPADCANGLPLGQVSRTCRHQRIGQTHLATSPFQSPSILPGRAQPRSSRGFVPAKAAPPGHRLSGAIAISISRTSAMTRARTIFWKKFCPCGQWPDWLRARPSGEVKFSVSSPRSGQATVPRSRPRHLDL